MAEESQSPKKIDTLVSDIYGLLEHGLEAPTEAVDAFSRELATLVASRLKASLEPRKEYLRFSNIGKDPLQLWYDINGYPDSSSNSPDVPNGADRLKFLYGDIIEALILFLAEVAGHKVADKQKKVELDGIKGSIDATIDGELVDVKSTTSQGLTKFTSEASLRANDSFGYVEQVSGYAQALGEDYGYFLGVDKVGGNLQLCKLNADDVRPRIKCLREILSSDTPPYKCSNEREHDNGNRSLKYPCTYCKHKDECWKDANQGQGLRVFEYSTGNVYLTNVAKEPRVKEITNER